MIGDTPNNVFVFKTIPSASEMNDIFDNLFACQHHNYTADGKSILHILNFEEVNSRQAMEAGST